MLSSVFGRSPYNLIQEHLDNDPWKILVACVFCNLTRRHTAEPIFWAFLKKYPSPSSASRASLSELEKMLQPLGLNKRRAATLVRMSQQFLEKDWEEPIELYGIGKYANDAWKIFCTSNWKNVTPKDHALVWYHDWLMQKCAEI